MPRNEVRVEVSAATWSRVFALAARQQEDVGPLVERLIDVGLQHAETARQPVVRAESRPPARRESR